MHWSYYSLALSHWYLDHFTNSSNWSPKDIIKIVEEISKYDSTLNINSLGPDDAIWWQRSGSSLVQVMACCLMAPSHYLNQCWLINHQWGLVAFIWGQFHRKCSRYKYLIWVWNYCWVSNIRCTLVGNKIVDHSDVDGASPVGAAPTTSSFSTEHLASMDWAKTTARQDETHLCFGIGCCLY